MNRESVDFEPLIQVLSKIEHLRLVPSSYPGLSDFPHVCWMLSPAGYPPFRDVYRFLVQFEGKAEWYVFNDFPKLCIFAQPKSSEELLSFDRAFLESVQSEIPTLASYLESRLGLAGYPSLGVEQLAGAAMEPDEYADFPRETVFDVTIVRDPARFRRTQAPTSAWDRLLYYGLTMGETDALRAEILRLQTESSREHFPLLLKVLNPYETTTLTSSEVIAFEDECKTLDSLDSSPALELPLRKLLRMTQSAQEHDLGIVFHGLC